MVLGTWLSFVPSGFSLFLLFSSVACHLYWFSWEIKTKLPSKFTHKVSILEKLLFYTFLVLGIWLSFVPSGFSLFFIQPMLCAKELGISFGSKWQGANIKKGKKSLKICDFEGPWHGRGLLQPADLALGACSGPN